MPAAVAFREEADSGTHSPLPVLRLVDSTPWAPVAEPDAELVLSIAEMNARGLLRMGSIRCDDLEDARQEFITDALARWPGFDPHRSAAPTFLTLVMRRRASSMIRARRTAKRGGDRHAVPFDLAAKSLEDDALRNDLDQALLRLDVRAVVAGLPAHQRRLCGLLARMSVLDAARRLGIARHVALKQMSEIRRRFVRAGFESWGDRHNNGGAS